MDSAPPSPPYGIHMEVIWRWRRRGIHIVLINVSLMEP